MLGKQLQISVIAIFVALVMANMLSHFAAGKHPPAAARPASQKGAAAPAAPNRVALAAARNEYRIAADAMGQYSTDAEINGARISNMLVDTGATTVALSYEDASAIGVFPAPADYKYSANTANGVAHVARVKLHDVRVGNLVVYDVDALVGERGALNSSLLGMTFLSKLSRFEVASGALVLRQ
ncbi:TIGR02281 family clan AA aspartic protease [Methylocystis sp. WRRC1]|uniref:retropepsin-like aspartic protease family protein n=1 Tax=unclassified Methylocystis TaxID=2625913 RepID=UPI0001F8681C|nr:MULTISPECIES: TIGR02281 family clan AA aspartic protease [unclassified Methylocystis]MCC3247211.1 TIGR02281 family clan AA aspartic protease [Methylocystis sp. WRRC1]